MYTDIMENYGGINLSGNVMSCVFGEIGSENEADDLVSKLGLQMNYSQRADKLYKSFLSAVVNGAVEKFIDALKIFAKNSEENA